MTGTPALYDLQRAGTEDVTHAEAGRLDYDVDAGVIRFSDQATITEGGNQISSNVLVYNIAEQRINADSTGEEDGRVRITYTPPDAGDEVPAAEFAERAEARSALLSALVYLYTSPGLPILYYGTEQGFDGGNDLNALLLGAWTLMEGESTTLFFRFYRDPADTDAERIDKSSNMSWEMLKDRMRGAMKKT